MRRFMLTALFVMTPVLAQAASVTVNWTAGTNAVSHRVERRIGASAYSALATVPMPTATYTDGTVIVGNNYCYRVVTISSVDEAAPSAECCSALMSAGPAGAVSCTVNP